MLKAAYTPYNLIFKEPAITSRAVMTEKLTYFVKIWDDEDPLRYGVGECALFKGLSYDDRTDYEMMLTQACRDIASFVPEKYQEYPSILFGIETAFSDFIHGGIRKPFIGKQFDDGRPIVINGLVWMGNKEQMIRRVDEKLKAGFKCVKFKIGGIDFDEEFDIVRTVRNHFPAKDLEIRLDANGGFSPLEAMNKLELLSQLDIHSIEQPIKPRQWSKMKELCDNSPIDIALDEELIGLIRNEDREEMLDTIKPQYIILKPSLCGGFSGAEAWIRFAESRGIGWWATSALESNIGLNAIARWVDNYSPEMPQGLGTGNLYENNIGSPLTQTGQSLVHDLNKKWSIPDLKWIKPE